MTSTAAAVDPVERPAGPGHAVPWLDEMRTAAAGRFAELGWPGRTQEAWKYTDFRPLGEIDFVPLDAQHDGALVGGIVGLLDPAEVAARLVFVAGRFRPDLSHWSCPRDLASISSLSAALAGQEPQAEAWFRRLADGTPRPLVTLNTAHADDGFVIRVGRGARLNRPIEVVFAGGHFDRTVAYHPRHVVIAAPDSEATIVETHLGGGATPYFANHVIDARVERGAQLRHVRVQADSLTAFHATTMDVVVAGDAAYEGFILSTGAQLSRFEVAVRLDGSGARCHFGGAYCLRGRQHCDITTVIEHLHPHTTCREVVKGVLDGSSRGVFQGRIVVHPGAQKTDGRQVSRALLLSRDAEVDAKPELEIFADDVKCSHGATAGQLDGDALFYLRSRGISEAAARRLLVEAFLRDAFEDVAADDVRAALEERVSAWMTAGACVAR
jgi:Fe-S cluster assembly protein SufD